MSSDRAKTSAIIENDLTPYTVELLLEKLGEQFFPIATDVSNKGNTKMFPLCLRFFNPRKEIENHLLDFYEDVNVASMAIYEQIKPILIRHNLPLSRISSYSAYNAVVNYGVRNSVYVHLKKEVLNIIANTVCRRKAQSFDVGSLVIRAIMNSPQHPK